MPSSSSSPPQGLPLPLQSSSSSSKTTTKKEEHEHDACRKRRRKMMNTASLTKSSNNHDSNIDDRPPPPSPPPLLHSHICPRLIACGYRRILIPKSGLSFPAFLVEVPMIRRDDDGVDNDDKDDDTNDYEPVPKIQIVWRSKRDFLLLGRIPTMRQRQHTQQLPPYKSCLKKLVADQTIPWKRPDYNWHDAVASASDREVQDIVINPSNNQYHISMKKSIMQLDQLLHNLQSNSTKEAQKVWNLFCRPGHTDNLIPVPMPAPSSSEPLETNKGDVTVDDDKNSIEFSASSTTSELQSSQLGQYFCSDENATIVVQWVLNKLKSSIVPPQKQQQRQYPKQKKGVVFIEPSCGHGDILFKIIQELQQVDDDNSNTPQQSQSDSCSPYYDYYDSQIVVGLDIDPNAIKVCREKWKNQNNNNNNRNNIRVSFQCQNFLESKFPVQDEGSDRNNTITNNNTIVCCLGGPPYTSGAGSGHDMQRDLPIQFIRHCLTEYQAKLICFLLPERYQKMKLDDTLFENYKVTIKELSNSTFYFQGNKRVTQPSILFCIETK